ncbi:hypothetical protein B7494_g5342 [Chlorociboria aeruginascens]|nr:hypothetical protein B7494_g5342 [Chlorociboria aeruginascens]
MDRHRRHPRQCLWGRTLILLTRILLVTVVGAIFFLPGTYASTQQDWEDLGLVVSRTLFMHAEDGILLLDKSPRRDPVLDKVSAVDYGRGTLERGYGFSTLESTLWIDRVDQLIYRDDDGALYYTQLCFDKRYPWMWQPPFNKLDGLKLVRQGEEGPFVALSSPFGFSVCPVKISGYEGRYQLYYNMDENPKNDCEWTELKINNLLIH